MTTAKRDMIEAAMCVAEDAAHDRLDPADLAATAAQECRTLFGTVTGPGDALWPLQVEVCRAVLAARGIPADELTEWLAVARHQG